MTAVTRPSHLLLTNESCIIVVVPGAETLCGYCDYSRTGIKLRDMPQYEPEAWRDPRAADPTARDQCRLLDLLGRINYRILSGNRVYIEVEGVVYKTLFGGYWRSVFTGIEHYLLRCERVSSAAWADDNSTSVDLPIAYSAGAWTTSGHSLSFLLNRSSEYTDQ